MNIELSNGLDHLFQWDTGQKVKVPENVPTVHFKWGNDAVSFDVVDGWVEIPSELTQKAGYILLWTYREDHTLDAARIPVERRPKPYGYAYTPTEIKTWESLDARIKALEKGGGVDGVTSVNGKTGAVELTAEDVGAASEDALTGKTDKKVPTVANNVALLDGSGNLVDSGKQLTPESIGAATEEYVDNNSKMFVINITSSINDNSDKVYSADKTYSEISEALNNGLLPVCKMPKHETENYVYGLCYFSGTLNPPIGNDRFLFRNLDADIPYSKHTVVSIDSKNNVIVSSESAIMTGATESRPGAPGYAPGLPSYRRNYFLRGDASWEPALQPPTTASVGQYLSVKTVDNNGIVTETEAVDAPSAVDLSLGITGATVGQTVKISAVDANGVPTAWVPVNMGSGEKWEKIAEIVIPDGAAETNALTINKDINGEQFSLIKARICVKQPKYTGDSSIPSFSYAMINGKTAGRIKPLAYTNAFRMPSKSLITGSVYEVDVSGAQQIETVYRSGNAGLGDDIGSDFVMYSKPRDEYSRYVADTLWAKPITSIGGAGMLIYPGCRYVLYGVRE